MTSNWKLWAGLLVGMVFSSLNSAFAGQPPSIIGSTITATQGQFFSYQIVTTNNPASFSATGLPANIAFDTSSGVISGIPLAPGFFPVSVTASNASGTGSGFVDLVINPEPPMIIQNLVPIQATQGGEGFSLTVIGTNFTPTCQVFWNGQPLQPTIFNNPNQLTAQVSPANLANAGTAMVTVQDRNVGIPSSSYPFNVEPSTTTSTVANLVISPPGGPLLINQSYTFTAQAEDQNGNPVTAAIAWSVVQPSATITSQGEFLASAAGTYTVMAQAGIEVAQVSFQVNASTPMTPPPPIANSGFLYTLANTPLTITLSGQDPSLLPLTYSITTNPADGALGPVNGNQVVYTPASNFNGTDSFAFTANNGYVNSLAPGTMTIVVGSSWTLTILTGGGPFVIGRTYQINAAATSYQGFPMALPGNVVWSTDAGASITSPSNGVANFTATTPGPHQITAVDGSLQQSTTIQLITAYPTTLIANTTSFNFIYPMGGTVPSAQTLSLTSINPSSGVTVTTSLGGGCPWLNLSLSGSATPITDSLAPLVTGLSAGTYSCPITFLASGAANLSAQVNLTVINSTSSLPAAPAITSPTSAAAIVGSNFTYTITATNSPTSFNASGLPAGLAINTVNGVISGTPSVVGASSITLTAINAGGSGTGVLILTVNSAPIIPPPVITSAANATATVGANFSYTVTATNNPSSFNASGLPAGLTINAANGVISGVPNAVGFSSVTLTASNAGGPGTASVFITINNPLPPPVLSAPTSVPVTGTITVTPPPSVVISSYEWTIQRLADQGSVTYAARATASGAVVIIYTTQPSINLADYGLTAGLYLVSVRGIDASGTDTVSAQQTITIAASDFSGLRVFPSPWRSDQDSGHPITFEGLSAASTIKIFTVSGHLIKTLGPAGSPITWDLTNDSGGNVASGLYLYLITDGQGTKIHGKFGIIR